MSHTKEQWVVAGIVPPRDGFDVPHRRIGIVGRYDTTIALVSPHPPDLPTDWPITKPTPEAIADAAGLRDANAKLIAAAPETFTELAAMVSAFDELCGLVAEGLFDAAEDYVIANHEEQLASARAAITKATE